MSGRKFSLSIPRFRETVVDLPNRVDRLKPGHIMTVDYHPMKKFDTPLREQFPKFKEYDEDINTNIKLLRNVKSYQTIPKPLNWP